MRTLALLALLAVAGCAPSQGEIINCHESWVCPGIVEQEVATDDKAFCTDPDDNTRGKQIVTFQDGFAETCGGVPKNCGGGVSASCSAVCSKAGPCSIEKIVDVEL